MTNEIRIPELESFCGSWVVSRKADSTVIGEFFERYNVEKFNSATCTVETGYQYLTRINREVKK
jgi:hypothetical protein